MDSTTSETTTEAKIILISTYILRSITTSHHVTSQPEQLTKRLHIPNNRALKHDRRIHNSSHSRILPLHNPHDFINNRDVEDGDQRVVDEREVSGPDDINDLADDGEIEDGFECAVDEGDVPGCDCGDGVADLGWSGGGEDVVDS